MLMNKHKKHKPTKQRKLFKDAFGVNEYGLEELPMKISGTTISRLLIGQSMGCSYCFPHGIETYNSHYRKHQQNDNWKRYRKHQWKDK